MFRAGVRTLAWSVATLIFVGTALAPAALGQNSIYVSPKRVTTTEAGSITRVTGTWRKDQSASGPIPPIPPLNSVTVVCDKAAMRCHEAIAMLAPSIPLGPADTLLAILFVY